MEKKEEPKKNIYQRVNAVMQDIDYIQKDQKKKVNNQYTFVSHDQVTSTLHGPLTKHGIAVLPTIKSSVQNGNRTEIVLDVTFVNIDDPADRFSIDAIGYGIDAQDKGPGKAVSYAFKYALLKVFCLETGDDPDFDQKSVHKPEKAKPVEYTEDQTNNLIIEFLSACEHEDHGLIESYLKKYADHYKKPMAQAIHDQMDDMGRFQKAFATFKAREKSKAS